MSIKRLFDITCSCLGLILLSPVFIVIAVWIKSTSKGSVFFRQIRVGLHGTEFLIHKFRTMVSNAEDIGPKITIGDDPRVTTVGKFLRRTKLDELPQLIDVFMGKMSMVGPRPEVPEYVEVYPLEIRDIILSVRPGITDWASIKLIDENKILAKSINPKQAYIDEILPKKLSYAVKYVKTRTLVQDIIIILATVNKIFFRK